MFSGLRQGTALYVLDKSSEPKVVQGYIERISAPHPLYPNYNPSVSFGANLQTAVDITVKLGDDRKEFVGVPSTASIHSYGDYVLSESKDSMIQEVTSILANMGQHESNVAACEKILKELNPVYAREQERDEAIDNISGRMDRIEGILARLENKLNTQV